MTDRAPEAGLRFLADLQLDVDGVPARVRGDGPGLVVETDHPLRLARAARSGLSAAGGGSRAAARTVGERLAAEGVSVSLAGPRGRLATVGAVDSALGGVLVGTRRVRLAVPPVLRVVVGVTAALAMVPLVRSLRGPRR